MITSRLPFDEALGALAQSCTRQDGKIMLVYDQAAQVPSAGGMTT